MRINNLRGDQSVEKIRWGILGSASIAKRAIIPAIKQSETGEVAAIASRSIAKAKETAEEFDIPVKYGSYEELLSDDTIDAVYIPLPNYLHKEWTIKSASAGKHVLCEKPLALYENEAKEMVEACNQAGVVLTEGFMYRYHPRYKMIREIIESGEIGEIRGIRGTFTYNNPFARAAGNFRYKEGGGSIYDIGVYPITAARMLLGQEPQAVTVHALLSEEHENVDMMVAGILEFDHGVALSFDCGLWAAGRNTLEIIGSDGRIEVPSAFITMQNNADNFFVITLDGRNDIRREVTVPYVNEFALQMDAIGNSILFGERLPYPAADSVLNMKVIDACLQSARERRRVEL
jgi:D-xylose 1-dehydrogenase (NADP+, D-xylono-1,5-lactone-forming)